MMPGMDFGPTLYGKDRARPATEEHGFANKRMAFRDTDAAKVTAPVRET
jgi:hypothetical protein